MRNALIEAVRIDDSPYVRTNCLASLGGWNLPSGVRFVKDTLSGYNPDLRRHDLVLLALYRAARDFPDQSLVDVCIATAPVRAHTDTLEACLGLCRSRWSTTAEAYCVKFLEIAVSPTLAPAAFQLLPESLKAPFIPKILALIEDHLRDRSAPAIVQSLKGLKNLHVENRLCALVDTAPVRVALSAVEVLRVDYPECLIEHFESWIGQGRPHQL